MLPSVNTNGAVVAGTSHDFLEKSGFGIIHGTSPQVSGRESLGYEHRSGTVMDSTL